MPKAFSTFHDQCPVHIGVLTMFTGTFSVKGGGRFRTTPFCFLTVVFRAVVTLFGCLQLQCHSRKPFPAPPPDFQYPMNSPHYYSRYRNYFLHFGIAFFLSIKSLNNVLFLIKPLSVPNSASPSRNVFSARGLITSLLWGSNTCSTSSAMFVTG